MNIIFASIIHKKVIGHVKERIIICLNLYYTFLKVGGGGGGGGGV